MGFLKKMLKKPLKDVKKVAKIVAKVDPIARTGMKLDPIARKVTGVGQRRNPKLANQGDSSLSPVSRQPPRSVGYSVGQGNAPAPRSYNTAPSNPPVAPLRRSPTRNTMSTLGSGKYRIK